MADAGIRELEGTEKELLSKMLGGYAEVNPKMLSLATRNKNNLIKELISRGYSELQINNIIRHPEVGEAWYPSRMKPDDLYRFNEEILEKKVEPMTAKEEDKLKATGKMIDFTTASDDVKLALKGKPNKGYDPYEEFIFSSSTE